MAFEENLNSHSRAMALALDDHELPVHVQAALAITKLVIVYDSGTLSLRK
jgi:alpha-D-ribose 1-methylphosphonate 5-triphosphate synthase subunit PhnH